MSDYLTREEILGMQDIPSETVLVPEWGGKKVLVRGLTGTQRDEFEELSLVRRGKRREVNLRNMRSRLVAASVVDPVSGKKIFREEDVPALGDKSAAALQRVFNVAMRLSGISDEDVEELAKNSDDAQSDDSGSG